MSYWNYRVVRLEAGKLAIEEVGYADDGTPENRCDPSLVGDELAELRDDITAMARALEEPIVELSAFRPAPPLERDDEPPVSIDAFERTLAEDGARGTG